VMLNCFCPLNLLKVVFVILSAAKILSLISSFFSLGGMQGNPLSFSGGA